MDRATELEHLEKAKRHIDGALARIAELERRIAEGRAKGFDVSAAEGALGLMRKTLMSFREHRAIIEQTLEWIDSAERATAPKPAWVDRDSWCDQFSDELLKLQPHTGHGLAPTLALHQYDPVEHPRDKARQYHKAQIQPTAASKSTGKK
jgi:hypothetical protein